jgi:hypothetical protein
MLETVAVVECDVTKCAYNREMKCHTPAITVGSMCPACDTYTKGASKAGESDIIGTVGACRKDDCSFNQSLECTAPGIHVAPHMFHADCATYRKK